MSIMPELLLRARTTGESPGPGSPSSRTIALAISGAAHAGPAARRFAEFAAEWVKEKKQIKMLHNQTKIAHFLQHLPLWSLENSKEKVFSQRFADACRKPPSSSFFNVSGGTMFRRRARASGLGVNSITPSLPPQLQHAAVFQPSWRLCRKNSW